MYTIVDILYRDARQNNILLTQEQLLYVIHGQTIAT
jgi:hypothetical protein